jgi:hypothetical protein
MRPEALEEVSKRVEKLRISVLFDDNETMEESGADPECIQFFLLGIAALESAQRFMQLAAYKQSQALASTRNHP